MSLSFLNCWEAHFKDPPNLIALRTTSLSFLKLNGTYSLSFHLLQFLKEELFIKEPEELNINELF